jgi:hypothetical protein
MRPVELYNIGWIVVHSREAMRTFVDLRLSLE